MINQYLLPAYVTRLYVFVYTLYIPDIRTYTYTLYTYTPIHTYTYYVLVCVLNIGDIGIGI